MESSGFSFPHQMLPWYARRKRAVRTSSVRGGGSGGGAERGKGPPCAIQQVRRLHFFRNNKVQRQNSRHSRPMLKARGISTVICHTLTYATIPRQQFGARRYRLPPSISSDVSPKTATDAKGHEVVVIHDHLMQGTRRQDRRRTHTPWATTAMLPIRACLAPHSSPKGNSSFAVTLRYGPHVVCSSVTSLSLAAAIASEH